MINCNCNCPWKHVDKNKLYLSIVERRHQLHINSQLMSLDGSFLSSENKQLVKEAFNNSFNLNIFKISVDLVI